MSRSTKPETLSKALAARDLDGLRAILRSVPPGDSARLLARLDVLDLAGDTIVVFLTDNGPQGERYTSGLRGQKGTLYEGGIRVPCSIRWPRRLPSGLAVDRLAAHIDLVPTLLDACGVKKPEAVQFDGVSLLATLGGSETGAMDRTIHLQWRRRHTSQRPAHWISSSRSHHVR